MSELLHIARGQSSPTSSQRQYTLVEGLTAILAVCFFMTTFGVLWLQPARAQDREPIAFTGHGGFFDQDGRQIPLTLDFAAKAQAWYRTRLLAGLSVRKTREFAAYEKSLYAGMKIAGQDLLVLQHQALDWLLANTTSTDLKRQTAAKLGALRYAMKWRLPEQDDLKIVKTREPFTPRPEVLKRLQSPQLKPPGFKPSGLNPAEFNPAEFNPSEFNPSEFNPLRINPKQFQPSQFPSLRFKFGGAAGLLSATTNSGQAYINECRAAGVPIPPSINLMDPSGLTGWKSHGFIRPEDQFIVGTPAEVRTYTSPEGMCYALPRFTDDTKSTVQLDGVICLSKQSSKVCFWDNVWTDPATGTVDAFQFPAGTQIPIGVPSSPGGKYQAGGMELENASGGICSDCHAGENPFIVHPKSNLATSGPAVLWETLSQSLPTMPVNRYDPIVAASWPQNQLSQAARTVTMLSCASCHIKGSAGRFPHISNRLQGYCTFVLPAAIRRSMPPAAPGSEASAASGLLTWCNSPPNSISADGRESSGLPGALGPGARQVAVAPLSDGRLEAWVVTPNGRLFSTWKVSTDPNAGWAPWFDFLAYRGALPAAVQQVAMAPLPDGRLEAWVVTANGGLFSTWKVSTDPNANWAPWFDFLANRGALPAAVQQVAMARLPDGRLEAWVVTANGGLFSTWKVSTDPNADWAPWFDFLANSGALPAAVQQVAMAPLPDGRLEAWVVTANGGLFSTLEGEY